MKKTLAALIMLIILTALLPDPVFAESGSETIYYGNMMVDNCEEWVSLRDIPDTDGTRLAKVPLHSIVTDSERGPLTGDFIFCNFDGKWGYILAKYLVPWEDPESEEDPALEENSDQSILDVTVNDYHITAARSENRTLSDGEYVIINCEDPKGLPLWTYEATTDYTTELTLITVFIGGTEQDPLVMVSNSQKGLTALEVASGKERWSLDENVGASISWAVDKEGNTYIGGYYGPDPVCINMNGNIIWRSDSKGCYWLYNIEIVGDELVCSYDIMDGDHDSPGTVTFGLDGTLLKKN